MKRAFATVALCICAAAQLGFVNPQLQPADLFERHNVVLVLEVAGVDDEQRTVELAVTSVVKGEFAPKRVVVADVEEPEDPDAEMGVLTPTEVAVAGEKWVAFVGKDMPGHETELLLYAESEFHTGAFDAGEPGKWRSLRNEGDTMWGTFNGFSGRLADMVADIAAGRGFFPALPMVKFGEDVVIHEFEGSVRGVALADLDGDGELDVYACHESGNRAFVQEAPWQFADATERLGLLGLKSASCSVADYDGDGRLDLLVGTRLLRGRAGGFEPPADSLAGDEANVKAAAFVDLDADGYADVLAAMRSGGLRAWRNPGRNGGAFAESTAEMGLDNEAIPAETPGFFALGDFNDDGRVDVFFAVGQGLLLVQGDSGRFTPRETEFYGAFKSGRDREAGWSGAGGFAPIWREDSLDLVFPMEVSLSVWTLQRGKLGDVSAYGNEINEGVTAGLATLAEDLNMDGYVDLYTTSWSPDRGNTFYTNRGYGSFMNPFNYAAEGFAGSANDVGAWGTAAGDIDGDGATDLLLGGTDGKLRVVRNLSLELGRRQAHPRPIRQWKVLIDAAVLSVRVRDRVGAVGARVRVYGVDGRFIMQRQVGLHALTGCSSPTACEVVLRHPGKHRVEVRLTDGTVRSWMIDAEPRARMVLDTRATPTEPVGEATGEGAVGEGLPKLTTAPAETPSPAGSIWTVMGVLCGVGVLVAAAAWVMLRRKNRGRA